MGRWFVSFIWHEHIAPPSGLHEGSPAAVRSTPSVALAANRRASFLALLPTTVPAALSQTNAFPPTALRSYWILLVGGGPKSCGN